MLYANIPKLLLFNLANDPLEMHDLAGESAHAHKLSEMKAALRADMQSNKDPYSSQYAALLK